TDPPHEIHNVPRPHHRMTVAPNTDASRNLIAEAEHEDPQPGHARDEQNPSPNRRFVFAQRCDPVGNPPETPVVRHQRYALQLCRCLRQIFGLNTSAHFAAPFSAPCAAPAASRLSSCSPVRYSYSCTVSGTSRPSGRFGFGLRTLAKYVSRGFVSKYSSTV